MSLIRRTRIFLLLFLLFLVAAGTWLGHARLTDWDDTVWVEIHPIAGDRSRQTIAYIARLQEAQFRPIERFFQQQARQYRVGLRQPVKVVLGKALAEYPPEPPADGSLPSIMFWSLSFRYWAWQQDDGEIPANIDLFVIYHDPALRSVVPHSLGMKEGHIGVVHAFADGDMTQSNNVVIAHELLHTLGASDKYDPVTNLPLYPDGFVEPERRPLYPQDHAEIMAGRIPQSQGRATIPDSLDQTLVGSLTATEIGWLGPDD